MAQEVQISPGSVEQTAKIRHPVAVPVLTLITLGIYGLYWWYQVNREMRDLGRARGVDGLGESPTNSLLAWFPGALIIVPPYVSLYNGSKRIQRAQEETTGEVTYNGWIVIVLLVASFVIGITGIIIPGYIQSELNKAWESLAAQGGGELADASSTGLPPADPAPQVPTQQPPAQQPPVEPPRQG